MAKTNTDSLWPGDLFRSSLCNSSRSGVDQQKNPWYNLLERGADMDSFVVTKENLGRAIPSMVAENAEYHLRLMYDGDYLKEREQGQINPKKMLINAKPKKPGLYQIAYQAFDERAFVTLPSLDICTDDVEQTVEALEAAKDAAPLIRKLIRQYL